MTIPTVTHHSLTTLPPAAANPLHPVMPVEKEIIHWRNLHGSSLGLAIGNAAHEHAGPLIVITPDTPAAQRLEYELHFYIGKDSSLPILNFPDWETLPYDVFSPHQDIISQRLATLYQLPALKRGILIVPVATLMQRLAPRDYLEINSLVLELKQQLDLEQMRARLNASGYQCVAQVMEHGEFAVRGSLLDLFPMGSALPYRIDLFDKDIDSIRTFDPESQRSLGKVSEIRLLPAREFPLTDVGITRFRQNYRVSFEGDPHSVPLYRDVSQGLAPPGIEYYLPLFFERTQSLFDYLPKSSLLVTLEGTAAAADGFWKEIGERYEQGRHDRERPLLPPDRIFLQTNEIFAALRSFPRIAVRQADIEPGQADAARGVHYATRPLPDLAINTHSAHPLAALTDFLEGFQGRVLFAAETTGRREALLDILKGCAAHPAAVADWPTFLQAETVLGITVAPLEQGLLLDQPPIAVIAEAQLFGERVMQRRRRKVSSRDTDAIVRNLTELHIGSPVVHEDHGVGRYLGLQTLKVSDLETEFLTLEYAGGDKLYVPVSSLHLIGRYTGAAPEQAPLHRLGGEQWQKAKRKASERVRDVAAELLDIHARRAARKGHAFPVPEPDTTLFATAFPFEETPDQEKAIADVLADMASSQPMDRLVCGDVGFGKTEVAMRAAFIAVQGGKQVAMLVPTTLLAQQHFQSFQDRFADWPVRIEMISRFRSKKEQDQALTGIASGAVDIIIGTHKLLQQDIDFKNIGLVILDEEHRFGVRQKERFKALRAEVDVLTLTATPIPRTLSMSLSGLRDLSIIATPPAKRLAVKTFVREWNNALIHEACLREIKRGGQVYFLHNDVATIERMARDIEKLVPEATVRVAHGQLHERELERVMADFYHQRFNVLVCSTIIETGIDVPSANTIIMNRADKFGLAQLYQLRGRVGRSHHRAYAYLIIPPRLSLQPDAIKRLDAIESIEELGTGFTLASHDLEIRGAGELLGEEQSGQMHEIGYSLYTELLERAVHALQSGRQMELDQPLDHGAEIDLHVPALLPENYLPDIHARLIIYKRIAGAKNSAELDELQVEMIDRFGLLPEPTKTLVKVTELKLKAAPLGIRKIDVGIHGGRLIFGAKPNVDPAKIINLIQTQPKIYRLDGQDKLRFIMSLPDAAARIDALGKLLARLM